MQSLRGYIFSRSFMGERVPQHIQNLIIRDYCNKNGYQFLLSATEYAMEGCHLIFDQLMDDLVDIDGVALYSLFQLPIDNLKRDEILSHVLNKKKSLHFAVEGLRLETLEDKNRVDDIWKIKLVLPHCLNY